MYSVNHPSARSNLTLTPAFHWGLLSHQKP